jgi:transglutaminase-like putative cysteine protease
MDPTSDPLAPPLDLVLRVGCELTYSCDTEAPALVTFKPRHGSHQSIRQESVEFAPKLAATEFEDDHANLVFRLTLKPGANRLRYDGIISVPSAREDFAHVDKPIPPEQLPAELLRYTMPSRYCDSDKLLYFSCNHFGHLRLGLDRVRGISDWLHQNIEYRAISASPSLSASEVIDRRHGVCRDFAHCGVALCRTFNLPTRYVSGYLADVGCEDAGTPMDFHAYFEVFMGGHWQTFDARFGTPRIGRVQISTGYDAGNCAFTTIYGAATLTEFYVWTYQIDPEEVHVGDSVDLSKRFCGTPEIQFPTSPTREEISASLVDKKISPG